MDRTDNALLADSAAYCEVTLQKSSSFDSLQHRHKSKDAKSRPISTSVSQQDAPSNRISATDDSFMIQQHTTECHTAGGKFLNPPAYFFYYL